MKHNKTRTTKSLPNLLPTRNYPNPNQFNSGNKAHTQKHTNTIQRERT